MHVAVFGANGATGRLLTRDLLDVGHDVMAIARHPDSFPLTAPRLTVVGADATCLDAVRATLQGADAVVSTLGTSFSRRPVSVYSVSAAAITRAMTDAGARRLVVTSSAALSPWTDPAWSWFERTIARRLLEFFGRTVYDDMRRIETIVTASDLIGRSSVRSAWPIWTCPRPTRSPRITLQAVRPPAVTWRLRSPTSSAEPTTTARSSRSPQPTSS